MRPILRAEPASSEDPARPVTRRGRRLGEDHGVAARPGSAELVWAGIDPVAMLTRHADRLVDVHVKDLDLAVAQASRTTPTGYDEASERGLFREPGTGGIDLDAVLAALPDDFPGWIIIEIDRTVIDPLDSARACREWVEQVTSTGALRPPRR